MKWKLSLAHYSILGFLFSFCASGHADVIVGKTAPDFSLSDTHGKTHSLSDYKGKFVVLEWTNHECPFVRKHYKSQNMQTLQKDYTGKGVVWLSVGSSAEGKQGYFTPQRWNELTEKKGAHPTAVLLDLKGEVGKMYGAKTTPHMFVISPEGELLYQGAIDDIPSVDPADIPDARNYVRAALDAAMVGDKIEDVSTKSYGCSVKYAS